LVVGYGARGSAWGAEVRRARGLEVAGAVDPEPAARERAARDGLRAWAHLDEALHAAGAEAAIVASPPAAHTGQAVTCLEHGLAVLVEKPLALSTIDARRVVEAAQRARRPALVGQNFALRPLERAVRATLGAGLLGGLCGGLVASARPETTGAHLATVAHAPLWDLGVHHFDSVRGRVGAAPSEVRGEASGSTYRLTFTWADGRDFTWWHQEQGLFHHHEWWRGELACLEVRGQRPWLVRDGRRPTPVRRPRRPSAEQLLLRALTRAARHGSDEGHLEAGANLATLAMVEAAATAIDRGETVPVDAPALEGSPR
jgi:predicted dehydrogenase